MKPAPAATGAAVGSAGTHSPVCCPSARAPCSSAGLEVLCLDVLRVLLVLCVNGGVVAAEGVRGLEMGVRGMSPC